MRLQLISDLHLETESFEPTPTPDADVLVLAGDIDSGHAGLDRFAGWPVPVLYVAGNHEYDGRDFDDAHAALRARCARNGITMLERDRVVLTCAAQRVRFIGTTLWNDFELFGAGARPRCMRAARYFVEQVQRSTRGGAAMDVEAVRQEGMRCRDWLAGELQAAAAQPGQWDRTVVVTHFAPSLRSADPRYPRDSATASFCNAYEALIARSHLWLHGHVHCRHDYRVGDAQVVCNARGRASRGESGDFQPLGTWVV